MMAGGSEILSDNKSNSSFDNAKNQLISYSINKRQLADDCWRSDLQFALVANLFAEKKNYYWVSLPVPVSILFNITTASARLAFS